MASPLLAVLLVFIAATPVMAQHELRFNFADDDAAPGEIHVPPEIMYSTERGYGHDPRARNTASAGDGGFFFSARVPEGNYLVEVTLGDGGLGISTTVKAESRRLMLDRIVAPPGERVVRSFTVNVRESGLPDGGQVRLKERELRALHWDEKLTLQFSGPRPAVRKLRIAPAPDAKTIFLAGDSTVTDQVEEPWAGWGQLLPRFFKPSIAVSNHAESGESLRSFRVERRLEKILSQIRPGDYLLIQFGHNDMKETGDGIGAFTSFKRDLESYISEASQRHAHVVLLTPMHRRRFNGDGTIQPTHGDYPQAVRQVAAEQNVPLIDLQAMSKQLYEALGPERSKRAFVHYPANIWPGQEQPLKDDTHFNEYGGELLARCVVEGLRRLQHPLAEHVADDVPSFDPSEPGQP